MKVRDGYKVTELGLIPEEWTIKELRYIATICYGKSQKEVEVKNGKYKILGTGGIIGSTNDYLWDKPSVLIGRKGTIDKPQYIAEPFWTVDTLFYTKINDDNNAKWLYYFMNSIDLKQYNEATGVPSLSVAILNKIKIPVPLLPEQQRIAEILSSNDALITKTDELIEKTKEIKAGLMQELLTKGIGHTEFKDSELGRIPKGWEVKCLDQIAYVKGGKRVPKGYALLDEKTKYPYLRVSDFNMNSVNTVTLKYVSEDIYEKIKNYTISKNDIYISIAGVYLGIVGIIPDFLDGVLLTENAAKVVLKGKSVEQKYLMYYLDSVFVKEQINFSKGVTGVPKLGLNKIEKLKLLIPQTRDEQNHIAEILSMVDNKIEALSKRKQQLEEIKKGLMQDLLTGRVRVV